MSRLAFISVLSLLTLTLTLPLCVRAEETVIPDDHWALVKDPGNSLQFIFTKGLHEWGKSGFFGERAPWQWTGLSSNVYGQDGVLDLTTPFVTQAKTTDQPAQAINIHQRVEKTGPNTMTMTYTLSADTEQNAGYLAPDYSVTGGATGTVDCYTADDTRAFSLPLPTHMGGDGKSLIAKLVYHLKDLGDVTEKVDPPMIPWTDNNDLRLPFLLNEPWNPTPATGRFAAGSKTYTFTFTFPGPVDFLSSKEEIAKLTQPWADDTWYPLTSSNDTTPSVIGMEDWMDAPAGKHGHLLQAGDHFAFEDGAAMKMWGLNLEADNCYPPKENADAAAAHFAKYGVNCVRFGQFIISWGGFGDPQDSTKFDAGKLDRMDYFTAKLKEHGVYYGWLHTWNFQLHPGDKPKLLAYDEIMKNLGGNVVSLIQIAPDVQDLMIEMVRNLLSHKNPYTNMTYAEDPGLAFLETVNETNVFCYQFSEVDKCPTYKKQLETNFAIWLKAKYGTADAWKQAWGGIKANESLDGQVGVLTNPWYTGSDGHPGRRLLDNAAFLHSVQDAFYTKFHNAMRAAGFKGPIEGGNWWSPPMVPHLYNLQSDAATGWVDRHNYFGGAGGGMFASMLSQPGSGTLSSGLQQVKGAAFGQSEWTHVYPNTYSAEGVPIMAAYAMGLQGWSSSFQFQSRAVPPIGFSPNQNLVGNEPYGVWNAERPSLLGQYPTMARLLYRGEVKEGEVISVRRVSDDNLLNNKFDFSEGAQVTGDVKNFKSSVPGEALAAGKVLLEFTGAQPAASTFPDMAKYQPADKVIQSTTKQLTWDYSKKGFILIDTPGTKGVVGFTPDTPHTIGNITLTLKSPFAALTISALEKDKTLENCRHALISIVARESNTGFKYFILDNSIFDNGKTPILMQPVQADVKIAGRKIKAVNVLDFDGHPQPDKKLPVDATGQFTLDTGKEHTMYYEVVFN